MALKGCTVLVYHSW